MAAPEWVFKLALAIPCPRQPTNQLVVVVIEMAHRGGTCAQVLGLRIDLALLYLLWCNEVRQCACCCQHHLILWAVVSASCYVAVHSDSANCSSLQVLSHVGIHGLDVHLKEWHAVERHTTNMAGQVVPLHPQVHW